MEDSGEVQVGRSANGDLVITPRGEVSFGCIADFRQTLAQAPRSVTAPAGVVVDLQLVTFMDSTGLAALVMGLREAEAAGVGYLVCNADSYLYQRLLLTGLLTVLNYALYHAESGTFAPPVDPEGGVVG